MKREQVLTVSEPDDKVKIEFLSSGSKAKKRRRACTVNLTVEGGQLRVEVIGEDDRCTILCDEVYDLPAEDMRR